MPRYPILVCVPALMLIAASPEPAAPSTPQAAPDPVASALSAAPAAIAAHATVVDGAGKVLRPGTNGWTCMPDMPQTPGNDPMCLDKGGLAWAQAWMGKKTPDPDVVGLSYMLQGGSDASNTDPFADKPSGAWVDTGPHIMILNARIAEASGYYKGPTPDTKQPYVMFAGTPYAHLMVPVN